MDRKARGVLGKRGRKDKSTEKKDVGKKETVAKRPKVQEAEGDGTAAQAPQSSRVTRSKHGMLTPEPSKLTESQVAQVASPEETIDTPPHTFPFMKLPAELRVHVYRMALEREVSLLLHAERALDKTEEESYSTASSSPTLNNQVPYFGTGIIRPEPRALTAVERTPLKDPILPAILRLNQFIYKEARQVLYSDNVFTLCLTSGIYTLSTLHQRSRSLIKHVVLTIPSHHDILDGFADLVRLGLRYCWGLKSFKIILQATLPDDGRGVTGATSVYANAFHILRWLPKGCQVILEGCVNESVMKVVKEEGRLMSVLDEVSLLSGR